jgi:hypothetical protein
MDPLSPDEFQNRSQSFLAWFKSLPGATFDDRLCITDLRDRSAGRGISEWTSFLMSTPVVDVLALLTIYSRSGRHPTRYGLVHNSAALNTECRQFGVVQEASPALYPGTRHKP